MNCCAKLIIRGQPYLSNLGYKMQNQIGKNKWSNGVEWMILLHRLTTQGFNIWKRIREAWENNVRGYKIPPTPIYLSSA